MSDSSLYTILKTLHTFFTNQDPEYRALETKLHIRLTRLTYRIIWGTLCITMVITQKGFWNIMSTFMGGFLLQLFMTEKTVVLMKFFSVVVTLGFSFLRLLLVGPETMLFNDIQVAITPLTILSLTNSYALSVLAFVFSGVFVKLSNEHIMRENELSPIVLEKAFLYLKDNFQIINFILVWVAFLLVCQKQTLLAHLWLKEREKSELLRLMEIKTKELEDTNKSKSKLLLGLSHEFRNPINAALGNLELANEQLKDPVVQKYLTKCKVSIQLLFHFVTNLLDSTKLEAGILEQNIVIKKSSTIFGKVWNIVKDAFDKKNLNIELYIDKKIPEMLNVDSHFISKIILNLIFNGVKYTEHGGVMTVITWITESDYSENHLKPCAMFYSRFVENFVRKKDFSQKSRTDLNENRLLNERSRLNDSKLNQSKLNESLELCSRTSSDIPSEAPSETIQLPSQTNIESRIIRRPSLKFIETFQNFVQKYKKFSTFQESPKSLRRASIERKRQSHEKGYLKIEVFDSGCGMDLNVIKDVIFKKFASISQEAGTSLGLGLGLWLVENLCEIMGGRLRVFSEKEKGSQFVAVIPMEAPDYVQIEELRSSIINTNLTALVVDDDKFNRDINTTFLARAGVTVKAEASDGQEAVDIYTSNPVGFFDFIVIDLEMPVMGGKEAMRRIRWYEKENKLEPVKIVVATGNCDLAEYTECMKKDGSIRADMFYRKPLLKKDVEEFVEILKREKANRRMSLERT